MLKYRGNKLVRTGFLGVVLAILIVLVGLSPETLTSMATAVRYQAQFSDAGGLQSGNDVTIAGIKVGSVSNVSLQGRNAVVTFSLDSTVPLGSDTTAHVRTGTLLGERVLTLESVGSYYSSAAGRLIEARFSILTSVVIERRRVTDRDQLALFEAVATAEPGVARVIIAPNIRENLAGRFTSSLSATRYLELASPVARRLYRLLEVARAEDVLTWRVSLERLKELLPLVQRYPSHLQRVLQPAHEMLEAAGVVRSATVRQQQREWFVDYVLAARGV